MQAGRLAARYYGLPEATFFEVRQEAPMGRDPVAEASRVLLETLRDCDDAAVADEALRTAARTLRRQRRLTGEILARMRGDRTNWSLRHERFDEAMALYRKIARSLRAHGDLEGALNAVAGEARAASRSGHHAGATRLFEQAIGEAARLPIRSNLLRGLATAHLLEATERRDPFDAALIGEAVAAYRRAIAAAPVESPDRAMARLGLARALGQGGDQAGALAELDRATAELAHLGLPAAKVLIENRSTFAEGGWEALGLRDRAGSARGARREGVEQPGQDDPGEKEENERHRRRLQRLGGRVSAERPVALVLRYAITKAHAPASTPKTSPTPALTARFTPTA